MDNNVVQIDGNTAKKNFENIANNNEVTLYSDLNYELSKSLILNTGIGGKLPDIENYLFL